MIALSILMLSCSSCGLVSGFFASKPAEIALATPKPSLVSLRGKAMPLGVAQRGIAFTAFIPSRSLLDVALLPPLKGDDTRANRGLGTEYALGGRLYVLSQWPRNGVRIIGTQNVRPEGECDLTKFKSDGIMWTSRHDIVLTLQADGSADPHVVEAEARRLVRRGACR